MHATGIGSYARQGFATQPPTCLYDARYKLIFEPQKTVSAKVELAVEKNTGGSWKFELRLEATQPDVDGSITIQAGPGRSAVGELALFSPTEQPEHFTCHFSYDSSISFDVSPAEVNIPQAEKHTTTINHQH